MRERLDKGSTTRRTNSKPRLVRGLFVLEMTMFGSLLKAALAPVDIAVGVAADVVTMGGALTDQDKPYTAQAAERLMDNVEDVFEPEDKR